MTKETTMITCTRHGSPVTTQADADQVAGDLIAHLSGCSHVLAEIISGYGTSQPCCPAAGYAWSLIRTAFRRLLTPAIPAGQNIPAINQEARP
jgi:hypothetical protein